MGLSGSEGKVLTYYAGGRTQKEAKKERAENLKYVDKKETARHRKAVKGLAKKGQEVRARRKDERAKAKQACDASVAQTKARTKDKPSHRRRAELAKDRVECAFQAMNVEEHAAQDLEAIDRERDQEVTRRRSSRIAAGHNRQRDKERSRRVSPRERREEMLDRVRHDLDPDLLPFFEEAKSTATFKKLCDGGRMTPTEAVLHMAHEAPMDVFAALERYAERELRREVERFENEGGRLATEAGPTVDAEQPARERSAPSKPRGAAKRSKTTSAAGRVRGSKSRTRAAAGKEGPQSEREIERFEHEGGRVAEPSGPDAPQSPPPPPGAAPEGDGARAQDDADDPPASAVVPTAARASKDAHLMAPVGHASAIAVAPTPREAAAHEAKAPTRRLSPEERTGWIPGTEPAAAPPPAPAALVRTTLFDEAGAQPEARDAPRPRDDAKGGRDPAVQQAFGTDFTSWLTQAGPQLSLDASAAARAQRPAVRELASTPTSIAQTSTPRVSEPRTPHVVAATPSPPAAPPSPPAEAADESADDEPPRYVTEEFADATLYEDRKLETLQVRFDDMPPRYVRIALRQAGFRWSPGIERWQGQLDETRRARAQEILREYAATQRRPSKPGATGEPSAEGDGSAEGSDAEPLNAYERKRAARIERLRGRADALQGASNVVYGQARARADIIPFGQPILVGHHSEGRDRRFRGRIEQGFRKAFELHGKAQEMSRRADAAEKNSAISSDDPDAIEKLRAKVKEKEALIDRAKDINAVVRAARTKRKAGWEALAREQLSKMGIPDSAIDGALQKDFAGRYGVPSYVLTNARGEIARLERRIEELEQRDKRPSKAAVQIGDATLSEDRETNRVQIRFEGIPSKDVRRALRSAGFVWAPSAGAWQRKLSEGARWRAEQTLKQLYPGAASRALSAPGVTSTDDATSAEPTSAPSAMLEVAPSTTTAPPDCERQPGGLCKGATVYAVTDLKGRDQHEISAGREGKVVDATCNDEGPCMYLVRWGDKTPSWHDATEITIDRSIAF